MSEEKKTVELKEQELEKVSGGYSSNQEIINDIISKLNSVAAGGGDTTLAGLINDALVYTQSGAFKDAVSRLKTIIENYGGKTYIPLYANVLSVIQDVYFTFIYDLNVS